MEFNLFSKWGKRQPGYLEMLFGKGDSNNGNKEQHSEDEVHQTGPQSAEDDPQNVQRNTDTTGRALRILDFCTERPKTQQAYLEGL